MRDPFLLPMTGTYAGPSRYVVTFVGTETPVANAGDEIEIRVEDASGLMLGNTRVTLSTDALNAGVQKIDVTLTAVEGGKKVFAVRGTVFAADGATLGGDGLRVTVENLGKGRIQTDITGTVAGPSQYVITFLDTENPVAEAGDEIKVRAEGTTGKLLGTAQAQLSADAINVGFTTIDVILTAISFPWDINDDGTVNIFDLVLVGSQFGQSGSDLNGDANNDGTVNIFDLVIVGSHFGESTAIAAPLATKARKSDNLPSLNFSAIKQALPNKPLQP